MPDGFERAVRLLPVTLWEQVDPAWRGSAEEFRLRTGQPPAVLLGETERQFAAEPVTEEQLRAVLDAATESSFHAAEEELRRGYLAAAGGVRVGVCGTAVPENGGVRTIRDLSSLSIRIPRQIPGAGSAALRQLGDASVLILSPPGAGKTTFLRELARTVSDGGTRVALADERGEIAAVWRGVPQFDVGRCTDVLTGAPKAEAATMLLRAMNPQAVALDELSDPQDTAAALRLAGCGVRLFATVHAASVDALRQRPVYRELLETRIFQKAVCITRRGGERSYEVTEL